MQCHICNDDDDQMNLSRIRTQQGDVIYAHGRCINQHNKTAEKQRRTWDAATVANYVSDHDLDATSNYVVAKFLRERGSELRELLEPGRRFDERFIDEVTDIAFETRKRNAMTWVFEQVEKGVAAWPAEPTEEFLAGIIADLGPVMYQLTSDASNWQSSDVIETEAVRCAALLLIKQVAWRKYETELDAAREAYNDDEEAEELSS